MSSGVKVRAAVKRPAETSDYGTGATNPTNLLPMISEGISNAPIIDQDAALVGQAAAGESEIVGWNPAGGLSCSMWFEGLEYLLLAAMGFENPTVYSGDFGGGSGGSPAPDDEGGPTCYYHIFECDENLHREPWQSGERSASSGGATDPTYWTASDQKVRSVSLCIDKPVPTDAVHHFLDCMVKKATFSFTQQKMSVDFDLLPYQLDKSSAMNRDNWAAASASRALFSGVTLQIGSIGASLGSTFPVQEATIELDNGLDDGAFETGSEYRSEPRRGESGRTITGKIKLARYASAQWETWMDGDTDLQAMIKVNGPTIPGSSSFFQYLFILPALKVTKADFPTAGPGVITGDIEFKAFKPTSTQDWLTTYLGGITQVKNNEFIVRVTNDRACCFSRDRQASGVTLP